MNPDSYRKSLEEKGYAIVPPIYDAEEVHALISCMEAADDGAPAFRRSRDLYAVRSLLKSVPGLHRLLMNASLQKWIAQLFGPDYFLVKGIYFDKVAGSNWTVAWHQDLTISVDRQIEAPGYSQWSRKAGEIAVRPPLDILQSMYTIRIHLDETTSENGALRVIPGTHRQVHRYGPEMQDLPVETCEVPAGGALIMRPLLMHSSLRNHSERARRVIHLEFSNRELPEGMRWRERPQPILQS